ncbi:MAG: class II glutamine amidotransferase [SAR324 cluster bacterium]|nr:class II glutamine amidotransferase [SAR324 cluster bacterium]
MCELLGLSCSDPSEIKLSFNEFCLRGGSTNIHKDGWGIGFYDNDDDGWRIFLDDKPAFSSKFAEVVKRHSIKSRIMISHIRRATVGALSISNNQPFMRFMWGRQWVFAHNGDLPLFSQDKFKHFNVIGQTDSEKVFCTILDYLWDKCPNGDCDYKQLTQYIEEASTNLSQYGVLNFLLSDGKFLFAHSHSSLYYTKWAYPAGQAGFPTPGISVDSPEVNQSMVEGIVVATLPLSTCAKWHKIGAKQVFAFEKGQALS